MMFPVNLLLERLISCNPNIPLPFTFTPRKSLHALVDDEDANVEMTKYMEITRWLALV